MRSAMGVAAVLMALSAPVLCAEMLANPGFEAWSAGDRVEGWQRYGGLVPESQMLRSSEARTGECAVHLRDTGPNERDGRWATGVSQTLKIRGGACYSASVWAKCIARNHPEAMNLQMTFRPSGTVRVARLTTPIAGDWRRFTLVARAPEGDTEAVLYLYTMHFWTCEYLLDDASMAEIDALEFGELAPLAQHGGTGIERVRQLNLATPLVVRGEPKAVICTPSGADWRGLGDRVQAELERTTGVRLPVTADARSLVGTGNNIIAIGNLNNNFVIERLYWNKYLVADSASPGAGRYVIRTVHEPFNFGERMNVLTVEASDWAGAQAGVEALLELLPGGPDVVLDAPVLRNPGYAPLAGDALTSLLDAPVSQDAWLDFCRYGELYRDRGDAAYAEKARRTLRHVWDRYLRTPDYAVTWPEETNSNRIGAAWDVLEESPVLSDEDRLWASRALLALCYELPSHTSGWGSQHLNETITWNHTTFPILGIYWLARHFQRWYGDVDGKTQFALDEVRGCFGGQMKCWKPQCDADGYLTIVPRHLIEYTLAENDYRWFEDGHCRAFAEYLTALSDNKGVQPGLGDSGYTSTPGYELAGLPMAFWYYKDGRYLWRMQETTGGKWVNPYDQGVRPRKWYSLAGVTVTPLHPEVYNYTKARGYYGEPPVPPNVPIEKAFDKITFRESIKPDAEFILLDGYASGKHLHYDGNAIIKFCADGEDWLIDADYLVRNTTEHNMVSVTRDGRCDQLIPVCAGLEHMAHLSDAAITQTKVSGYNGADWTRHMVWMKGEFLLVIDECEALHDGEYSFETVWKTLDRGSQTLEDGRVFSTQVSPLGGVGSRALDVVADPAPGVAKAMRFRDGLSQLDFGADLPAGQYQVELLAKGLDAGTDSFWLKVDGGEPIAFHVPIGEFGPSSSSPAKEGVTPNVSLSTSGPHLFSLTLRENPGVFLDRVAIRTPDGSAAIEFEAEQAPPVPPGAAREVPDARFFIKSDGDPTSSVTTRVSNVGLRVRKLHQRFGGPMKVGDRASSINLLYNDTTDAPKDYDVRRIGESSALILKSGAPFGVFTARPSELGLPWLVTDASALMVAGDRLYGVGLTRMVGVDARASQPISIRLDLARGYGVVHATAATTVTLPGDQTYDLGEGDTDFDSSQVGGLGMASLARGLPALMSGRVASAARRPAPEADATGFTISRSLEPTVRDGLTDPVTAVCPGDLTGDGVDEVLVLRGPTCICLTAAGEEMWRFEAGDLLQAVAAADLHGDGTMEVLVGGDDEHLYVLNAGGEELARHHVQTPLRVGTSSVRRPCVASICVGDLDLDGANDIVIGTENGNIARFDLELKQVWAFDRVEHGTRSMVLLNLDADPNLEIVAENRYGAVEVVSASGHAMSGVYSELGDVEMAVADLNGDGSPEIANGSSTGAFICQTYPSPRLFEFPNHGYAVTDVLIDRIAADRASEIVIASETGYVYCLDATGTVTARRNLAAAPLCLAIAEPGGRRELLVGCRDGKLYSLKADLTPQRALSLGWEVSHIAPLRRNGTCAGLVVAGEGRAAFVSFE